MAAGKYQPWQCSGKTCRKTDDPFAVLSQYFFIHPWFIIKAVNETLTAYLLEIVISICRFSQKDKMVIFFFACASLIVSASGGDIYFASNDRIDTFCFCFLIEINHAIHDSVIRDRSSIHSEFFYSPDVIFDFIRPIQYRISCMSMQMNKAHISKPPCHVYYSIYQHIILHIITHLNA